MSQYSGLPIGYGPKLPSSPKQNSGTLFYVSETYTDPANSPSNPTGTAVTRTPGLYIFRFKQDISTTVGDQVGSGWEQVSALDVYVNQGGDTMTGPLTLSNANLTINSVAPGVMFYESDQALNAKAWYLVADGGLFQLQTRTDALGLTSTVFSVNRSGVGTLNGGTIWHSLNDGVASGLDADLLDGQHGSFYTNLANSTGNLDINTRTTGTLSVARGGTNNTVTTVGGVLYGATTTQLATTAVGTSGQLLRSNGAGAPSWTNQSAITAGAATVLATARTISLGGDASGSASFDGSANVTITAVVNNASTADTLTTARTITLAGDVSGSVSFNGSANVTITTTVADDSHNHTGYVAKTGDTMTGSLSVGAGIGLNPGTGQINGVIGVFSSSVSAVGLSAGGSGVTNVAAPVVATDAANKAYVDAAIPAGTVIAWAGNGVTPTGWLPCNGALLAQASYPELFAAINILYNIGGESGTTFRLPDLRGKFLRAYDDSGAYDPGRVYGSYQADSFAAHTHGVKADNGGFNTNANDIVSGTDRGWVYTAQTLPTGGAETRPKNVAMRFIIKY